MTTLSYAFRWSGLEGRELSSWANPGRFVPPEYVCRQHEARSLIAVPLSTPASAIAPFVREATADLFAAFGGYAVGGEAIENLTERLLTRNL